MAVRLHWDGRDDAPLVACGALSPIDSAADPSGELIEGDNVAAMRALLAERAGTYGVAYLDPPYLSGTDYAHEGMGLRAYGDRWADRDAYLSMLWPVLRLVHALLAAHGTIWVQVDHRASGLVQPLLDELFGADKLRNVIAWRRAPPLGRQVQSNQFPRNLDLLFAYARGDSPRWHPLKTRVAMQKGGGARKDPSTGKWFTLAPRGDYTDESIARLEREGRIHRSEAGKVYVKYFLEEEGGVVYKPRAVDAVWDDVAPLRHASPRERTGYPTQKPEPLLTRILEATSDSGDRVLDPFAGSGTTAIAAARLGRRFTVIDQSPVAMTTARKRLAEGNVPVSILKVDTAAASSARRGEPIPSPSRS